MSRPVLTDADRTDAFRGMAHPLRRRVIAKLAEGEASVSELLATLQISPPALSRHLAVLRETGLVTGRLRQPHRYYKLRPAAIRRVRNWINGIGGS